MANLKKAAHRTNDRKSVGLRVTHHRSHAAAKAAAGGTSALHSGQPMNLKGSGLKTGGSSTNQ